MGRGVARRRSLGAASSVLLVLLALVPTPAVAVHEGPVAEVGAFADVDGAFAADVAWLAGTGITRGCGDPAAGLFCPDRPLTRGQLAAMLVRALDLPSVPADADPFRDDDGSTFEDEVERLAAAGVTTRAACSARAPSSRGPRRRPSCAARSGTRRWTPGHAGGT